MEELETTYLLKSIPEGLLSSPQKEMLDIYIPATGKHSVLRIRASGTKYEITKKVPVVEGDASRQIETTISLSVTEYAELSTLAGKRVSKIRYYYPYKHTTCEIDVFQDGLKGLVLVDVEFKSMEEKSVFEMPDFCLVDVTQEKFIAGGVLAGKTYSDIADNLARYHYMPVTL